MPIYEYRCKICHHEAEFLHGMDQKLQSPCPKGCGDTFERLISAPRVRFAGQGYYETDEKPKDKQRNVVRKDTESKGTTDSASKA